MPGIRTTERRMGENMTVGSHRTAPEQDRWRRVGSALRHRHPALMVPAARDAVRRSSLTPSRAAHTLAVGDVAARIAWSIRQDPRWSAAVEAIGVLHDIGYAHPQTGMHSIDGARVLYEAGAPREVCTQVAHHSTAIWEVAARGMNVSLRAEFGPPDPVVHAIIWVADFATSPTGHLIASRDRIADIRSRYGQGSEVITALDASLPFFQQARALLRSRGAAIPD